MIAALRRTALALGLLALPAAHAAPFKYSCDLLDQHGSQAYGRALNAAGKTAGWNAGAARWSRRGKRADLPGAIPGQTSDAHGINDAGRVVGYSGIYGFPGLPTVWDGDVPTTLPLLPGGADGQATALNNTGMIAGTSTFDGGDVMHAVVWDGGAPRDLGALGDSTSQAQHPSYVTDMNQAGEMVGFSEADAEGHRHAVYWGADRKIIDLGTLPRGAESSASAINGAGTIVGASMSGGPSARSLPVVWVDRAIRGLALQPGQTTGSASAINASGQIVGANGDEVAVDGAEFKFVGTALLWPNADQAPIDLNAITEPCKGKRKSFIAERLVWTAGINAKGVILAEFQGLASYRLWYFQPARLTPLP